MVREIVGGRRRGIGKIKYPHAYLQRSRGFFLRIQCKLGQSAGSKRKRSSNGFVQLADPISDGCVLTPVFYLVVEKLTGIERQAIGWYRTATKKRRMPGSNCSGAGRSCSKVRSSAIPSSCSYAGCRSSLRSIQAFLPMMRRKSCRRC